MAVVTTDNKTPHGADGDSGDESGSRDPTVSELFQHWHALAFGEDSKTDADAAENADNQHGASTSTLGRTDHAPEPSMHDSREAESCGHQDEDNRSSLTSCSCGTLTAEPPSPTTSTAPMVTVPRPPKVSLPSDEVVVPVWGPVAAEPEPGLAATCTGASASSLPEGNPTYPPSVTSKNSHAVRGGAADGPTLPVVVATVAACAAQNSVHVPPDGGLRAWGNVVGGFLVLFASLGLFSAFGVFQAYFAEVGGPVASPCAHARAELRAEQPRFVFLPGDGTVSLHLAHRVRDLVDRELSTLSLFPPRARRGSAV